MSAQIVMDAGGGPVIGSITLLGVEVDTPVTLSNVDNTDVEGWRWEIIDAPAVSPTLNPLPAPTFNNTAIITPDVKGHTILVRLTTYRDAARTQLDDVDQKAIRVKFDPPYEWIIPAAQQTVEADTIRGWASDVNLTIRDIRAFIDSGGAAGGAFSYVEVAGGEEKKVFDNSRMHWSEDVNNEGDLELEGPGSDMDGITRHEQHSIAYVPWRMTRRIAEQDVMYFKDLDLRGTLDLDGELDGLQDLDGQGVLDLLTEVAPGAGGILGATSPARFLTAAEVRTFTQTLTQAEVEAAALGAVTRFSGLTEVDIAGAGPHATAVGNLYRYAGGGDTEITLPATANDGEVVGFWSVQNDVLTVDGNTNQVSTIGNGAPTLTLQMDKSMFFFVYDGPNNTWDLVGDGVYNAMAKQPYTVLTADSNGDVAPAPGGPYLALSATAVQTADTVVGELNRTVRFRVINSNFRTLQLPASPSDGDRCAFQHWGNASVLGAGTLDGNGENIESIFDPTVPNVAYVFGIIGSFNMVFRYISSGIFGNERWVIEEHSGALDGYRGRDTLAANVVNHTDGGGFITSTELSGDDALWGRVAGADAAQLLPYNVHAMLSASAYDVDFSDTGSQSGFQPGGAAAWAETNRASWSGLSDLTIHGLVAPTGGDFSPIKVIRNENIFDNTNIIFPNDSGTEATAANRVLAPRQTTFYIGPQEAVVLRYDFSVSRWVIISGVNLTSLLQGTGSGGHAIVAGTGLGGTVFARTLATNSMVYRATGAVDDLVVNASSLVGRASTGNIASLTAAQVRTILSLTFGANSILKSDAADSPASLTVPEQTLVGRITSGVITALTAAEVRTLLNVEDGADVTDATNVDAAGAVMEADYNANTILAATTDDTPAPVTVAEQTLVGRITAGNITALTAAQVRTLLNVEDGATADQTDSEIQTAYDNGLSEQTLTDAATISYDVSSGRNANVTLTDNRVLNWTNPVAGQRGVIRIIQDGTGSRTITAYQLAGVAGDVLFAGGSTPTLTPTANAQDVLEWYYDGADIHVRVFSLDSQ